MTDLNGIPTTYLQQAIRYDAETGALVWREDRPRDHYDSDRGYSFYLKNTAGTPATSLRGDNPRPIVTIPFKGKRKNLSAHQIAWLLGTGEVPKGTVMPEDGDPENLRLVNLKVIERGHGPRRVNPNALSQYRGVTFHQHSSKWMAVVRHHGKAHYAGYHTSQEDAAKAFDDKARELGWPEDGLNFPR